MKRLFMIFLVTCIACLSASAQETETKQYLPEAGDWSIGIDVKPVFKYVSGLFNNYDKQADLNFGGGQPSIYQPDMDSMSDEKYNALKGDYDDFLKYYPTVSLMGRYMLTDRLAVKANFGILYDVDKEGTYSPDQLAAILDPLSQAKVANIKSTKKLGMSLQAGAEYRIGKKRIQGVFGGGLMFGIANEKVKYSYGNDMTIINQRPEGSQWSSKDGYRKLKEFTKVPNIYVGLYGSAGVEFFVAPKISLGAEVSLCAGYMIKPQKFVLSEGYNPDTETIEKYTQLEEPLLGMFQISTRNLGGNLYMAFYF